jgi:D-glycero-D-manno-heptose 1,7-bisphosphate phosphatase
VTAPAIFLDRDGTLIHPRHYPTRPDELVLYDNLGPELRALQAAGFKLVVITNQSGLARGLFTVADLQAMHDHLAATLAGLGVALHGVYHCPHHPEGVVAGLAVECACRKPRPGMLLRAAADLELDLGRSWFVGDILDDVEAGNRAGCRTVLVDLGTESPPASPVRHPDYVARDTLDALRLIRAVEGLGGCANLGYLPRGWRDGAVSATDPRGQAAASGGAE